MGPNILETPESIPMCDLAAQYREVAQQLDEAILRVARSGNYVLGDQVSDFESALAKNSGTRYAIGVNSGTDALVLALAAAGVGVGDEVITSPFSFFGSVAAICRSGATPRFIDIDPATFNISVARALTQRVANTKAVMPVHLFGLPAELANEPGHEIVVVADMAQAIGAHADDVPVGRLADLSCVSFFPTKNLGALGDGGAVLTDNSSYAATVERLRRQGASKKYVHESVGLNSRLDAIQATVLTVKLTQLERWTAARRRVAAQYDDSLAALDHIRTPPPVDGHVYHQYTIRVLEHRDELAEWLRSMGISTSVNYPVPLHLQPALGHLGYGAGDFPEAELACAQALSIPCFAEMSSNQVSRVIEAIAAFVP